jgi:hypothetical protein
MASPLLFSGSNVRSAIVWAPLVASISAATISCKAKLLVIQKTKSAISIGDMFEMQMLMNHLSQLSEMSTAVASASNTAIASMARNVKG